MTESVWIGTAAEKAKHYTDLKNFATIWCERQNKSDRENTIECEVIEIESNY